MGRSISGLNMPLLPISTPSNHPNILWQAHGEKHLWSEHATVANLNPLVKARMEGKDLHTGLCVGIVGGLETKLFNAKLFEELVKHPNQVSQDQVSVSYHPLDLVELCKVGGIKGFVPEDPID